MYTKLINMMFRTSGKFHKNVNKKIFFEGEENFSLRKISLRKNFIKENFSPKFPRFCLTEAIFCPILEFFVSF